MRKPLLAAIVCLSAISMLAACDDPSTASQPPSSPVPLQSAGDQAAREAVAANPSFDVGHTVHLTAKGIEPLALSSFCCDPIVFKNETSAPMSVMFNVSKLKSGPIAPGATWQWVPPNPESVIYHLVGSPTQSGQIQIESPNW